VRVDGHGDARLDAAGRCFEDYEPGVVIGEEAEFGLPSLTATDRHAVGVANSVVLRHALGQPC
jgi:hypothetical protein